MVVIAFLATTAAVALTLQPVIIASWVGIWAFAFRFGRSSPARLAMFFWLAFAFFYPATSSAFTSLQEQSTVNGVILVTVGLLSISGALYAGRRSLWFGLTVGFWILWGLVAYLPVFLAWSLSVLGAPPPLGQVRVSSSALKTAVPIIAAWAPAAAAVGAIRRPEDLLRLVRGMFWATVWLTVPAFLQAMTGTHWVPTEYGSQPNRLFGVSIPDANGYARLLLLPTLVLLSTTFIRDRRPRGFWGVLGLAVISIALTLSRTTYVSFAVGVLVLLLLNLHKRRTVVVVVALVAIVAGAAYGLGIVDAFSEDSERRSTGNLEQRLELYAVVWEMVRQDPWVGVRPGGYSDALVRSSYQSERAEVNVVGAHNMLLSVAVEWGMPMALALLAALVGTAWNGLAGLRRLWQVRAVPGTAHARALLTATIAIAATYGVHGLAESVPPEYVFFAFGLSLAARYTVVPLVIADAANAAARTVVRDSPRASRV